VGVLFIWSYVRPSRVTSWEVEFGFGYEAGYFRVFHSCRMITRLLLPLLREALRENIRKYRVVRRRVKVCFNHSAQRRYWRFVVGPDGLGEASIPNPSPAAHFLHRWHFVRISGWDLQIYLVLAVVAKLGSFFRHPLAHYIWSAARV